MSVEPIDTSISQDNISLEDLDAIVKKYALFPLHI